MKIREALERFSGKYAVCADTGCWVWNASRKPSGYGQFYMDGGPQLAHRVSYEMHVGDIPDGHQIDHLCRNPACVNPKHLEAVTPYENVRRSDAWRWRKRISHCPRGHAYSGQNLVVKPSGARGCRECQRQCMRALRARRAEAAK